MIWFAYFVLMTILLAFILMLFASLFDDPKNINGRKRGKQ